MDEKTNEKSPLDVAQIKEKIDNGAVKVQGKEKSTKKPKSKKSNGVQGVKGRITDAKICAYLKGQDEYVTSTQLRDACGFKSRTQARRVLKRLAKLQKVDMKKRKLSDKRQIFTFGIA